READARGEPVLVLGGGSNVVAADDGFAGTVVLVRTRGVGVAADASGGATVTVAAGEEWGAFGDRAGHEQWVGGEALAGIPGLVGAVPIQNVGAYGQEVAQTIANVRAYDRSERRVRTFASGDCGFAYRTSRFKTEPGRYVVLSVAFRFQRGERWGPVRSAERQRRHGVGDGERAKACGERTGGRARRRGGG